MAGLADMVRDDRGRFMASLASVQPEKRAAETARLLMLRRTARGEGVRGKFRPYAPSTARRKGRSQPVTLRQSGSMLGGMRVVLGARTATRRVASVTLGSARDRRIARYHIEGTRRMPSRNFFGLTPRERAAVDRQYGMDVQRAVPKDRRRRIEIRVF